MKAKLMAMSLLAFVAMGLLGSSAAYADEYAYTPVLIGVLTDKSFTVTLNGQSATASDPTHPGTATATLWFNSTDGNTKEVNASVAGSDDQAGPYPECDTPILVFKNTGTVTIDLAITLNNTVSGMVFFVNSSMTSGSTTGTALTDITAFSTSPVTLVTGLGLNNQTNVCIWGNFTAVAAGQHYTWFNYTSS